MPGESSSPQQLHVRAGLPPELAGPMAEDGSGTCRPGAPDPRTAAAADAWRLDPYRVEAARQAEADRQTRARQAAIREDVERAALAAAQDALAAAGMAGP